MTTNKQFARVGEGGQSGEREGGLERKNWSN
jgi:hypothetical protein